MRTIYSKQEIAELAPLPAPDSGKWVSIEHNGQTLGARVHLPESARNHREIIIDDSAWGVHASTTFDVVRSSQIAKEAGLLTIAIETPGMSPYSGPLTAEQLAAMRKGDWSTLGEAQWSIIKKVLEDQGVDFSDENPLTVHYAGYSMAASTLIGVLATAPDWAKTGHFISWENVALAKKCERFGRLKLARRIAAMMIGFPYSGLGMKHYKKRAPIIPGFIVDDITSEIESGERSKAEMSFIQSIKGRLMPVIAMAHGGDAERLRDALLRRGEQSTAMVHLWHGDRSRLLSRRKENNYGEFILSSVGIRVDLQHDEDGGHNVEDFTPLSVRRYTETIARPLPMAA